MARWAFLEEPEAPTKKSDLRARWIVLLVLCTGLFGSYYVYDLPAATENQMAAYWGEQTSNSTTGDDDSSSDDNSFSYKFNLLYSVYSWPNVVLPFFGGLISDKLGVRLTGVVFMGLILLGQVITSVGASLKDESAAWYVMWLGRTVFGLGGESLSVAQSAFVASYFGDGKELALAMGVNLALARVGSVVNDVVSAAVATASPVYNAYWVGTGITGISFLAMIYVYYLDLAAEQRCRANKGLPPLRGEGLLQKMGAVFCGCCCRRRKIGKRGGSEEDDDAEMLPGEEGAEPAAPTEEIHMSAVLRFPASFWVLTLSCVTVYIDVLVFNNNSSAFFITKYLADAPPWQMSSDALAPLYIKANSIMLITYLVSGFTTPFLGGAIDQIGLRAFFVMAAAVMITGLHAIFSFTAIYPVGPLVMLGLCYSIYAAALWPSIAVVVEPAYQATAYGLTTALQNLGLAVGPLVVAKFMPAAHCAPLSECIAGWNRTELFFVGCGAAGVFFGLLLNVIDHARRDGPQLNAGKVGCCARRGGGAGKDALLADGGDDVDGYEVGTAA